MTEFNHVSLSDFNTKLNTKTEKAIVQILVQFDTFSLLYTFLFSLIVL
jgi:hypothetical protein